MYEKLVSHKLSSFCEKYGLLPAAQFTHGNGLGSTDALLTISHHIQKFLDAGMESYIVQLDFSAALDSDAKFFFFAPFNIFSNLQICYLYDVYIYIHAKLSIYYLLRLM